MKIRLGFVGNSSSSSFCIYGIHLPYEEIITALRNRGVEGLPDRDYVSCHDLVDVLHKRCGALSGEFISGEETLMFGKGWSSIGGDETGNMFRTAVLCTIMELIEKLDLPEVIIDANPRTLEGEIST